MKMPSCGVALVVASLRIVPSDDPVSDPATFGQERYKE